MAPSWIITAAFPDKFGFVHFYAHPMHFDSDRIDGDRYWARSVHCHHVSFNRDLPSPLVQEAH